MINITIYCNKKHKDYERTYNLLNEVLLDNNLDFKITRITEPRTIKIRKIAVEPHIVINNQVMYATPSLTAETIKMVLQKLRLL